MKTLLEMCTKDMHFTFDGKIYRQVDGVAMGSPLGPVIANVFMVELERRLMPSMGDNVALWFRYVDDTFTFIKKGETESIVQILNSFHDSIKFTFEKEKEHTLSFLDVNVTKNRNGSFKTDIHRKKTDTNVYLSWKSFAPKVWKTGTLKGLIRRAFIICSSEECRNQEINFLRNVFTKINGFPSKVVGRIINEVRTKMSTVEDLSSSDSIPRGPAEIPRTSSTDTIETRVNDEVSTPYICLPFKGQQGDEVVRKFKSYLKETLPTNVKPRIIYKGKKIGSFFRIKDKIPLEHESDLIYAFKETEEIDYVGETKVRYGSRTHEHSSTDKESAIFKHVSEKNIDISDDNFQILERGYSRTLDRKLAEALYIKELDPVLNRQKKSLNLLLFN